MCVCDRESECGTRKERHPNERQIDRKETERQINRIEIQIN